MNKTKIEWADYTWNPVVGCKTGCSYCYAKRMNDRFKWIPNWKEPQFFKERLYEPLELKKPSKIFIGSMCDLFGPWIDERWIKLILSVIRKCKYHEFMFLTKYAYRYVDFNFPKNCHLGLTLTQYNYPADKNLYYLKQKKYNKKFLSLEPILGCFFGMNANDIDLVIVGAMTGPGAIKPQKHWIKSIKHDNIFYKNNIKKYL